MTYADEDRLVTLKYRLLADRGISYKDNRKTSEGLGTWGHEYIRHLALELGEEHGKRVDEGNEFDDLLDLALHSLVPFFIKHNAEADAVDLLSELEMIDQLPNSLDEDSFARVCLYMVRYGSTSRSPGG